MISAEIVREPGRGGGTVCRVTGEIDASSAEEFQAHVMRARLTFGTPVTLDLSGVGFMDCAGLNTLLRIRARVSAEDSPRDLRLRGLTHQVARLFAVCGAAELFDTAPSD